ncbi:MAG: POTRA domain-containing protein [Chitinophagales bacterium]
MVSSFHLYAQDALAIQLNLLDAESLPKKVKFQDKLALKNLDKELNSLLLDLRRKGYWEASIDTIYCDSLACQLNLHLGAKLQLKSLTNGNIEAKYWNKLGIKKSQDALAIGNLNKAESDLLKMYENAAFPFAEVWLDSISIQGNELEASLFAEKHDSILIDTLIIFGDTKSKTKFIQRYLGIQPGDPYNQQKIDAISKKLRQLPYLLESKASELFFTTSGVSISLFLQKQKSSQFNLLLGVLPNDQLSGKKITITGEGRLQLQNFFGVGEELFVEFEQLKPRTQNLDIKMSYPYFLNSPIGLFGAFNLYKNDSLFIDIKSEIGVQYQFGGFNQLKLSYSNHSSNVLNADTSLIKSSASLPSILDLRNNSYGLALELQNLNYVLNPTKGFKFILKGSLGLNKIKVNQSIASLEAYDGTLLQSRYDSLDLKKVNYALNFQYSQFIPIAKRSTFLLQNKSASFIAKNVLTNEKFRIGGYKILRGFDEEAIYTPYYSIFTTEFRFLLSKNSFVGAFGDFAIVEDERKGAGFVDFPIGFGLGLSLETKAGLFSLNYALGKNLDNKIQIRNGKIHFGFISIF